MNRPVDRPPRRGGGADACGRSWLAVIAVASGAQLIGCASPPAAPEPASATALLREHGEAEAVFGIHVEGLRLSAAGAMLDFRYRVVDPQKAAPILDGKVQPFLLDDARAARLGVPDTPKLGRIRQTARNQKILTDRTYFIMFGNPGKAVRSGDKVTLLLGELKITDLVVQ